MPRPWQISDTSSEVIALKRRKMAGVPLARSLRHDDTRKLPLTIARGNCGFADPFERRERFAAARSGGCNQRPRCIAARAPREFHPLSIFHCLHDEKSPCTRDGSENGGRIDSGAPRLRQHRKRRAFRALCVARALLAQPLKPSLLQSVPIGGSCHLNLLSRELGPPPNLAAGGGSFRSL